MQLRQLFGLNPLFLWGYLIWGFNLFVSFQKRTANNGRNCHISIYLTVASNSPLKRWQHDIMVIIAYHKPDFGTIFAFFCKNSAKIKT